MRFAHRLPWLAIFFPAVLAAQATITEAPADRRYVDAIASARAVITEFMTENEVPGLSVAVGVGGDIAWSEGFGFADLEQRILVTPLTKFRIGSVSKTLTADAVAILIEEGRLDLDAPVQRYVPSFPEKRWPVTTRQLAGHLSGVRHYRGSESYSEGLRHYTNVNLALRIFRDDSLNFEPGTRYSYSSYAWNLISAIVQSAEGEPFLDFIDRKVFEPLGMRHTVADHVDSIIPFRARFYSRRGGTIRNAPHVDNSYKWAGGGFLSNMEDLITFGYAHLEATHLQAETVELLWTTQRNNAGEPINYGIGWRVYTDDQGRRIVGHGGSSIGGRTQFIMYRDLGVIVAVTSNLSEAPVSERFAQAIARSFLPAR